MRLSTAEAPANRKLSPSPPASTHSERFTFRGNLKETRYGWLRLTPAYSVHLVREILAEVEPERERVLDPFCGTGTTALVCAELGISASTTDINPFLVWLSAVKTSRYARSDIQRFRELYPEIGRALKPKRGASDHWVPPLHHIERWWDPRTLAGLGRAMAGISRLEGNEARKVVDLLKIVFCQTLIGCAKVSFGHQSMSFARQAKESDSRDAQRMLGVFQGFAEIVATSAASRVLRVPQIAECDARALDRHFPARRFTRVITSPPYPNRMSYVRELRPYMYWLGYLGDGKAAGELDWTAIGGTWGSATSRLGRWSPEPGDSVPFAEFSSLVRRITAESPLLARYVHKYFCDMARHCRAIAPLVSPGGRLHYIVGNSKFYDVLLPVEQIFCELFRAAGFENAEIRKLRKRTSKPELFEYMVSATK